MGNLGNFGGTFNLGYFDGGTRVPEVGEPIGAGAHSAVFKTLSKNPLKLRLVRE